MARVRRIPALSAVSCGLAAGLWALGATGVAWAHPGPSPSGPGAPADPGSQGNGPPASTPAGPSGGGGSSTSGGGNAPPGNNGHIQVDEFVMDAGNDNDPHLSCDFSISFFGYDGGAQQATITITPWAPTGGGQPLTIGPVTWDVGTRTSGNQLDRNVQVPSSQLASALAGVTPAAQGYHLRIEVEVSGSRGADDKFKMFWLAPCTGPTGPTGGGVEEVPTTTTTTVPPQLGDTSGANGAGSGGGPTFAALAADVTSDTLPLLHAAPVVLRAATLPGRATGGRGLLAGALAFTGANIVPITLIALGLCGLGAALHRLSRRMGRAQGTTGS